MKANPFCIIVFGVAAIWAANDRAQSPPELAAPTPPEPAAQERSTAPRPPINPALSAAQVKRIEKERKRVEAYVPNFLTLPPKKRFKKWQKLSHQRRQQALDDALIVFGVDTAPWLARLVRDGGKPYATPYSSHAIEILCDMDRFVPADQFPLKDVRATVHVPSRNAEGLVNPYIPVDGRRIGLQAYEAVKWASEQWDNRRLRFFARYYTGLLEQDLRQLSLEEQIRDWAADTKCNHSVPCVTPVTVGRGQLLANILAERAPESIPPLLDLMAKNPNGFVRLGVVDLLDQVDATRMRLNATDVGRQAVAAALDTVNPTSAKRMFAMAWLEAGLNMHKEMQARNSLWKEVVDLQADDHINDMLLTDLTIYFRAFAQFYRDSTHAKFDPSSGTLVPTQEIRQFVAFLTKTDPYFPSWEYSTSNGLRAAQQILHPRFRAKVDRYYEQWKRFEQSTATTITTETSE